MIEELMHMLSDPAHLLFEVITTAVFGALGATGPVLWLRRSLHRELDAEHGVAPHPRRPRGKHRRGKLQPTPVVPKYGTFQNAIRVAGTRHEMRGGRLTYVVPAHLTASGREETWEVS